MTSSVPSSHSGLPTAAICPSCTRRLLLHGALSVLDRPALSPPPLSTEAVPCGNCHAVMWQLPRGGVAIANPKPFCRGYCQTKPLSWPGQHRRPAHSLAHGGGGQRAVARPIRHAMADEAVSQKADHAVPTRRPRKQGFTPAHDVQTKAASFGSRPIESGQDDDGFGPHDGFGERR